MEKRPLGKTALPLSRLWHHAHNALVFKHPSKAPCGSRQDRLVRPLCIYVVRLRRVVIISVAYVLVLLQVFARRRQPDLFVYIHTRGETLGTREEAVEARGPDRVTFMSGPQADQGDIALNTN